MTGQKPPRNKEFPAFRGRIFRTRLSLLTERVALAFWPFFSGVLVALAALRWGLPEGTNPKLSIGMLALSTLVLIFLLVRGNGRFHWPSRSEAIDRLDRTMPQRPLSTLQDRQAIGTQDPASEFVWQENQRRAAIIAKDAKPPAPDVQLRQNDPFALRLIALLAFLVAIGFGGAKFSDSFSQALTGSADPDLVSGPGYEGWIDPPAYTGLPTLYLNKMPQNQRIDVPQNSELTLRLYNSTAPLDLVQNVSDIGENQIAQPEDDQDPNTRLLTITKTGRVELATHGKVLAQWQFSVIPDTPPQIDITSEVSRTPQGAMTFSYHATDDYGVVSGQLMARLEPDKVPRLPGLDNATEPQPDISLELVLPYAGQTQNFKETLVEDLAKHPWAGLPVRLDLQVSDAAGQTGRMTTQEITLPGRRFFDPLAAALVEQRRNLLWNRQNAGRVKSMLRAITWHPEALYEDHTAYLITRTALRQLEYAGRDRISDTRQQEVAELLWSAAIRIEDGVLDDARRRMEQAQERLSEAIKNGATQEEIARLMDELRQATQEFLQQLAQNPRQQDNQTAQNQQGMEITQEQLQALMDRIQELTEQGRMAEAQELLDQLSQMMQNMQVTQSPQSGGDNQQMEELQGTLREQQDLADDAFGQLQDEFSQFRQQSPQPSPGQPQAQQNQPGQSPQQQPNGRGGKGSQGRQGTGGAHDREIGREDLARRQQALREMLSTQKGQLPEGDSEAGQLARRALQQAEDEMAQAEQNLRQGNIEQALNNQANAIDALREGIRQFDQALRQATGDASDQQGSQAGNRRNSPSQDPLGRQSGGSGQQNNVQNLLGDEDIYRRSREVLQEIRRRAGDKSRSQQELDYLNRLLERF